MDGIIDVSESLLCNVSFLSLSSFFALIPHKSKSVTVQFVPKSEDTHLRPTKQVYLT